MSLITNILSRAYWFYKIGYKFLFAKVTFRGSKKSSVSIHPTVKIKNSSFNLKPGSILSIEEGTEINNSILSIRGKVIIGKNNIVNNGYTFQKLTVNIDGEFIIGNNNRVQSNFLIRYGGKFEMGNYNNINSESEVRVDESVRIGNYNQISYKVVIWDTNTHNIYPAEHRRALTLEKFPIFGHEYEKPKTKPITIGDDCWIGREAALLKGVTLSNKCVVGYRTVLTDCQIEEGLTIISEVKNKTFRNNI